MAELPFIIHNNDKLLLESNVAISGVYCITSPSGKKYIGQSWNIQKRLKSYKGLYCKSQNKLYNSFLKHGTKTHVFEILTLYRDDIQLVLNTLEYFYWMKHKNEYEMLNIQEPCGAHGKLSIETKNKISESKKGERNHFYKVTGSNHPLYGIKRSAEIIQKIKDGQLRTLKEWKRKKGMTINSFHTDEIKKKMSDAKKGENHPKSKLTENDVLDIWRMIHEGYDTSGIATIFNVSKESIQSIKHSRNWKHLTSTLPKT